MKYIIGVPEVHINWKIVEADNVETAVADAYDASDNVEETGEELVFETTLEQDAFKVRLPDGGEVSSEEAIDLESSGERVGE